MQHGPVGSSIGSGGAELSRGGLARFRSAPTTWLESLLEDELDQPSQGLTQLLTKNSATSQQQDRDSSSFIFQPPQDGSYFDAVSSSTFSRQNSSPADFLVKREDYFSSYGVSPDDEYPPPCVEPNPATKRTRDVQLQHKSNLYKGEQSGHVSGGIDVDMDKLLDDSLTFRVRAKRGCATHPRSIAERVRRTRISDRIRKLQELVPNMDKQTNTADMLDEAVEYVKLLQRQIQELTEHQRKCTCVAKN